MLSVLFIISSVNIVFAENERYGFFPSFGVGYLMSNEKFWKPLEKTINKLKWKFTYGLVGNDAIGDSNDRFFYLSNVNMNDENKGQDFGTNWGNHIMVSPSLAMPMKSSHGKKPRK